MDKTTLGVIGAISSLVAFPAASAGASPAAAPAVPPAQSFSELLDPIPNALERLQLADAQEEHGGARLIEAQYVPVVVVPHHHHHHYVRPRYRRHYRRVVIIRHHHHHHHNNY